MWYWQRQLEKWTQRGLRLFWWVIDLCALVALSMIYFDGVIEAAKFASQELLIVCIMLAWQRTVLEEIN